MRFTEATGRRIVSTSTAATVGKLSGFVVAPAVSSVALQVKAHSGEVLRWSDLAAFGTDALTVTQALVRRESQSDASEDLHKLSQLGS